VYDVRSLLEVSVKISVSFFGPIRKPWPETTQVIEVKERTSLQKMLEELGYTAGDLSKVALVVNGRRASLKQELNDRDDVRVVLLAGGG
jgi:sulfur carrier protein ThiS